MGLNYHLKDLERGKVFEVNKQIWDMLQQLQVYCYICGKTTSGMCGTPRVQVGGCCYGYKLNNRIWICNRYAHLQCYTNLKTNVKGILSESITIKKLIQIYTEKKKVAEYVLKNEPLCIGQWRKQERNTIKKIERRLSWLKNLKGV